MTSSKTLAAELGELRARTFRSRPPEEFSQAEVAQLGVELNAWRQLLGRLHAVVSSNGRHDGWGILAPPPPPVPVSLKDVEPDTGDTGDGNGAKARRASRAHSSAE